MYFANVTMCLLRNWTQNGWKSYGNFQPVGSRECLGHMPTPKTYHSTVLTLTVICNCYGNHSFDMNCMKLPMYSVSIISSLNTLNLSREMPEKEKENQDKQWDKPDQILFCCFSCTIHLTRKY